MKRKHSIILFLSLLAILAVAGLNYVNRPPNPFYNGRTLSSWIARLGVPFRDPNSTNEAVVAIRTIGTNGLPLLIKRLRVTYSGPKRRLIEFSNMHFFYRIHWKSDSEVRNEAVNALITLGDAAKSAIPELREMLQNQDLAADVAPILAIFGREGYEALSTGLTNKSDIVRRLTVANFSFIGAMIPTNAMSQRVLEYRQDAQVGIPSLIGALNDKNSFVAWGAATALGLIRQQTNIVVPALSRVLDDTNSEASVREAAAKALVRFGFDTNAIVPATQSSTNHVQSKSEQLMK